MPPISSSNWSRCYLSQKHQNIFDPGKGKTSRGYLWLYIAAQGAERAIVLYDCQPGRSGQYARDVLEGWRVTLVVDGDAGYQALFGKRPGG